MVFKSIFKKNEESEAPKTGPLGLHVGRAAEIDFTSLRVAADVLSTAPPESDTFLISGYGTADLGGGSVAHRYYDDSNAMLQFLCEHGVEDTHIREITFFIPIHSHVPTNKNEWQEWTGPDGNIGAPTFEADNLEYIRMWDAHTVGHVTPVAFGEHIETAEGSYEIYQQIMLYGREAGFLQEYLIIGAEEIVSAGANEGTIEFLAGYDLHQADIRVI